MLAHAFPARNARPTKSRVTFGALDRILHYHCADETLEELAALTRFRIMQLDVVKVEFVLHKVSLVGGRLISKTTLPLNQECRSALLELLHRVLNNVLRLHL